MKANHPHDDELVLYYFGEHRHADRIEQHLAGCPACQATFADIAATLTTVTAPDAPERGDLYGLEVWQRLRPVLPMRSPRWSFTWLQWSVAGLAVAAALLLAGYLSGRSTASPAVAPLAVDASDPGPFDDELVRVAAVVDHLERSERLLLDVTNASDGVTLASERQWAEDLVDANRLYRESARLSGDGTLEPVLDDLERVLLDIVHAPDSLTAEALSTLRKRLDAAALLFKLRVLSNELRDRESSLVVPRKTT